MTLEILLLTIMMVASTMIVVNLATPYILQLWVLLRHRHDSKEACSIYSLSVIMPLFNEEDYVVTKMDNIRAALKEVSKPYEVLMGSDGSTDQTVKVVEAYIAKHDLKHWKICDFSNEGKGRTLSKLVEKADGDLIISTDADVSMDAHAITLALQIFEEDKNVGCLSSIPTFALEQMKSQSLYWNVEMKIRNAESAMGKLVVVTGWLYAFRRALYVPIPKTAMADDLWVPLSILLQGAKVIHHPDFKAYSEKTDEKTEIQRRKRVVSGGVDIVKRLMGRLLLRPNMFCVVYLHKINRWLLPLWLFLFVSISLILDVRVSIIYFGLLIILAWVLKPKRLWYIVQSLLSPVFAVFKMRKKKDLSKWEHTRIT